MADANDKTDTFLWVLRGLTTFPSGELAGDLIAAGLLVLFGLGYTLMWFRRELLAGLIFIAWYAALWILYLSTEDERYRDAQAFGVILLILGILFLVHRAGAGRRSRGNRAKDQGSDGG
jgi:hypothetical protein